MKSLTDEVQLLLDSYSSKFECSTLKDIQVRVQFLHKYVE